MIGILVLTHGELASGYISAIELIAGKKSSLDSLGIYHETNIEEYKTQVANKILKLNQGKGVLVFCDIFGASPYNVTAHNYKNLKGLVEYRSITGVNLPMLIEALYCREFMELNELSKHVQEIGKQGIKELFEVLERKDRNE